MEDWSAVLDDGDAVIVAYLDFAKAFDSVLHKRLLNKLRSYGVRGRLLAWLEASLTGRSQRVVVQGSKSAWAPVTSGILQESVLGLTLFILYVNDLPECVENKVKLFADDTKLYCRISDMAPTSLQSNIDALVAWSQK